MLCLNSIVKNESRIIERMLASVIPVIDTYCICDTGSTDDTVERIEAFMAKQGISGEVFREPFRDFGYNRTVALERAARWGTHALLLDADMKLCVKGTRDSLLSSLESPALAWSLQQRNSTLDYSNTRIVRTGAGIRCVGATHEFYALPAGAVAVEIPPSVAWIDDVGDGGSKSDKFQRDIRLLTASLAASPGVCDSRAVFYLANSYRDVGNDTEAKRFYKQRLELGGWHEELFVAALELGNASRRTGDTANAVLSWLDAWNRCPTRAESLYELTRFYRETGKHALAKLFCDAGQRIPYPVTARLFVRRDVYTILFDYERSILAFYTKEPVNYRAYMRLLESGYNHANVLGNYQFYAPRLERLGRVHDFTETVRKTVNGVTEEEEFHSSTPCILARHEGGYWMNVRFINYRLDPTTGRVNYQKPLRIVNLLRVLDGDLKTTETHWFDEIEHTDFDLVKGPEDVKIAYADDQKTLNFVATVLPARGLWRIGLGVYDRSRSVLTTTTLPSPYERSCEKNWALVGDRLIHSWSPLTVLDMSGRVVSSHTAVPALFKDLRGSSNGVAVGDNELWFVCHLVHFSVPRIYYHLLVVLDATTLAVRRHSIPFKFSDAPIEFSLGLVVEEKRILLSYSRNDVSASVIAVDRDVVERTLFAPIAAQDS